MWGRTTETVWPWDWRVETGRESLLEKVYVSYFAVEEMEGGPEWQEREGVQE